MQDFLTEVENLIDIVEDLEPYGWHIYENVNDVYRFWEK